MKFKKCNHCNGTGKVTFGQFAGERCFQCGGRGNLIESRYEYLVNVYWPKQRESGMFAEEVVDERVAELKAYWNSTDQPPQEKSEADVEELSTVRQRRVSSK